MAEPTLLDLWQRDTEAGSTALDIGATQDGGVIYPAELIGVDIDKPYADVTLYHALPLVVGAVPDAPSGDLQFYYRLEGVVDAAPSPSTGLMVMGHILEGLPDGSAVGCTGFIKPDHLFNSVADMVDRDGPKFSSGSSYNINVFRGPSGEAHSPWSKAGRLVAQESTTPAGVVTSWDSSARQHVDRKSMSGDAPVLHVRNRYPCFSLLRAYPVNAMRYKEAEPLVNTQKLVNIDLPQLHLHPKSRYMEGVTHSLSKRWKFYDKSPPLHRDFTDGFDQTAKLVEALIRDKLGRGARLVYENKAYYEEAGYPGYGRTPPEPITPIPLPWDPSSDRNQTVRDDGTYDLEFVEKTVSDDTLTIPPRKVYKVMNEVRLFMVPSGDELPLLSMSLDIDVDSWSWGHKLSLPYESLPLFKPVEGASTPVLDLHINGTVFRLLAEKIGTRRAFNRKTLDVSGRGISAYLSDPYAPVSTFTTTTELTANQVMEQVLTFNGQSIGWSIDWGIADWLVPAGVWSVNGTYMAAIKSIADAAGAFILPDPKLKTLRIRPRYPTLPWAWDGAVPHYAIPTDVVVQESIDWIEKPAYNAVYVSGITQGYLGYVKRAGSAGNLQSPMVTHPLITGIEAARQRGESILSQTGIMADVKLSLPVLPETGIIMPGKLLEYQDGGQGRMGVTTKVSLSQREGSPTLRQEVGVTIHG